MSPKTRFSGDYSSGLEPHLSEVLNDPVIHAVMARDGVSEEDLRSVITCAQMKMQRRAGVR